MESRNRCCEYIQTRLGGGGECYTPATAAKENQKEFRIEFRTGKFPVCRICVDGCLIADSSSKRSDYAFVVYEQDHLNCKELFVVELKGCDADTAYEQICATIHAIHTAAGISRALITGVMVTSGLPRAANQKFERKREEFRKNKTGIDLLKSTGKHIQRI